MLPTSPTTPCDGTPAVVTAFALAAAGLATATVGWILITVIWDDIRARVRKPERDARARDLVV
jgi:hypothetical protein